MLGTNLFVSGTEFLCLPKTRILPTLVVLGTAWLQDHIYTFLNSQAAPRAFSQGRIEASVCFEALGSLTSRQARNKCLRKIFSQPATRTPPPCLTLQEASLKNLGPLKCSWFTSTHLSSPESQAPPWTCSASVWVPAGSLCDTSFLRLKESGWSDVLSLVNTSVSQLKT